MVSELPPSDMPSAPPVVTARPVSYAGLTPINPLDLAMLSRREAALDLGLLVVVALLLPIAFEIAAVLTLPETPEVSLGNTLIVRKWFDLVLLVVVAGSFV
jgi:hypothetical protein